MLISYHKSFCFVLGLSICIGTALWSAFLLGGLGVSGKKLFNWHPIVMSCGAVLLLPQAILAWCPKPASEEARSRTKSIHAALVLLAFILFNIGIAIAYASHVQQKLPNFYSLHSWSGVATLFAMKGNLFGGIVAWLFHSSRKWITPSIHRRAGLLTLLLAFVTTTLGFAELQTFAVRAVGALGKAAVVGGMLGLAWIAMGALVMGMIASRVLGDGDASVATTGGKAEKMAESDNANVGERMKV